MKFFNYFRVPYFQTEIDLDLLKLSLGKYVNPKSVRHKTSESQTF